MGQHALNPLTKLLMTGLFFCNGLICLKILERTNLQPPYHIAAAHAYISVALWAAPVVLLWLLMHSTIWHMVRTSWLRHNRACCCRKHSTGSNSLYGK